MSKIIELTNKRNKLIADATVLVQRGLNTSDDKTQHKLLLEEIDSTQQHLDLLGVIERKMPSALYPVAPIAAATPAAVAVVEKPEQRQTKIDAAYRRLFRHGLTEELRDIVTTSDVDGAALLPQDFESTVTQAAKFYGPIANLVFQKKADTGRAAKFAVSNDTSATMSYLSEDGSASALEADPTLNSEIQATDSLVTLVKYSYQELEDASSFEDFLRTIAGLRVARAVEYALTLGKDNGTTTVLPHSPSGGLLGSVSAGVTQTSGQLAAGPTYGQLAALAGSVDHAYYVNGSFMASPSVFNFLLTQVTTTGAPLYQFDDDGNLLIAGKKLWVNNAMPAYNTASSPVVLFGDYSKAYAYLNGGGMKFRIITERWADTLEAGAVIYQRLGAASLVSGAVKSLVTAAS